MGELIIGSLDLDKIPFLHEKKTWDSLSFSVFAGSSLTGLKGLRRAEFGVFFVIIHRC